MTKKEYDKAWRKANRERYNVHQDTWRKANPEKVMAAYRKRTYGITELEYSNMVVKQEGLCAICNSPPGKRGLYIDHCHVTGRFRGLLCHHCNVGVGMFRDNPDLLGEAAKYLKK